MKDASVGYSKAYNGGGIAIVGNVYGTIQKASFTTNKAVTNTDGSFSGNGGGIYYNCDPICKKIHFDLSVLTFLKFIDSKANFTVENSTFYANRADKDGGAIKWYGKRLYPNSYCVFESNTAVYGPNVASYAKYIFRVESAAIERINCKFAILTIHLILICFLKFTVTCTICPSYCSDPFASIALASTSTGNRRLEEENSSTTTNSTDSTNSTNSTKTATTTTTILGTSQCVDCCANDEAPTLDQTTLSGVASGQVTPLIFAILDADGNVVKTDSTR